MKRKRNPQRPGGIKRRPIPLPGWFNHLFPKHINPLPAVRCFLRGSRLIIKDKYLIGCLPLQTGDRNRLPNLPGANVNGDALFPAPILGRVKLPTAASPAIGSYIVRNVQSRRTAVRVSFVPSTGDGGSLVAVGVPDLGIVFKIVNDAADDGGRGNGRCRFWLWRRF